MRLRRLWTPRPKMKFDRVHGHLDVEFSNNRHRRFDVVTRNDSLRTIGARSLNTLQTDEAFNVRGIYDVSFVGDTKCYRSRCGVQPLSMPQLRPWLKDGRCMYGDRQGTFGHYFLQNSGVAAPLT